MSTQNYAIDEVPENTIDPAAGLNLALQQVDSRIVARILGFISAATFAGLTPMDGDAYILTDGANQDDLAQYVAEGDFWRYTPAQNIGIVHNLDDDSLYTFTFSSSGWSLAAGLDDAPSDGIGYVRKDGEWQPESSAGRSASSVVASSAGVVNLDYSLGDYFTLALSEDVTSITFSNLPGSGKGATLMLRVTQDASPREVAWPASFKWVGGTAGEVSTDAGAIDVLAITTFDNGSTWMATLGKGFA